jgi:hypothetical protein
MISSVFGELKKNTLGVGIISTFPYRFFNRKKRVKEFLREAVKRTKLKQKIDYIDDILKKKT